MYVRKNMRENEEPNDSFEKIMKRSRLKTWDWLSGRKDVQSEPWAELPFRICHWHWTSSQFEKSLTPPPRHRTRLCGPTVRRPTDNWGDSGFEPQHGHHWFSIYYYFFMSRPPSPSLYRSQAFLFSYQPIIPSCKAYEQ